MKAKPRSISVLTLTDMTGHTICAVRLHPLQRWTAYHEKYGTWHIGYKGTWLYRMDDEEFNSQFVVLEEER